MRVPLGGCASLLGAIVLLAAVPAVSGAHVERADANPAVACATADLGEVHSGRTVSIALDCSGLDLSYTVSTDAAHGSASVSSTGRVTYQADGDYAGPDGLEVEVRDGDGATVTVGVSVQVVNRAPVCHDAALAVHRGGSVEAEIDCTDPDGDFLAYEIRRQPAQGSASASASGVMGYLANLDFAGPDTFTYGARDALAESADATATVTSSNQAPVCHRATATIRRDKAWNIQLSCSDADFDALAYAVDTPPAHGSAELVSDDYATVVVYRPAAGYTGSDHVIVSGFDGAARSAPARLDVTVTPNHAPVCQNQLRHIHVDAPASIRIACSDPDVQDAASLRFSVASAPAHGTLTGLPAGPSADASAGYTPVAGRTGADAFDVIASDGELTGRARTRMHVADTPFCDDVAALDVRPGGSVTAPLRCTQPVDAPGSLGYRVVREPARGHVTSAPGSPYFAYIAGDDRGGDSFDVVASGTSGTSNTVTVAITTSGTGGDHAPAGAGAASGLRIDAVAPVLTLRTVGRQKLRAAARRGVRLTIRSTEACAVTLVLTLDPRAARRLGLARRPRRPVVVARLTTSIRAGTTTVVLKPTAGAARAFKRARQVRLRLAMSATDAAGNAAQRPAVVVLWR